MTNHDKKELEKFLRTGFKDSRCIPGWRAIGKQGERIEQKQRAAQNRPPGPGRPAPMHYAGETFGPHVVQYPDVERYPNGALPAKRNKIARRLVRAALKRTYSATTKSLRLAQGLRAQAYEAGRDRARDFIVRRETPPKIGRWARRLLAKELAIHQTVYAPDSKTLRKIRTAKRARIRKGLVADPIAALVDKMVDKQP